MGLGIPPLILKIMIESKPLKSRIVVQRLAASLSRCQAVAHAPGLSQGAGRMADGRTFGRGHDTVGNPHRAQISQFELLQLEFLSSSFSGLLSYY